MGGNFPLGSIRWDEKKEKRKERKIKEKEEKPKQKGEEIR